jgi:hypothetical protein
MAKANVGEVLLYIQRCIADGRPDEDGTFVFARKELLQETGISPSVFNRRINEVVDKLANGFDFCLNFNVPGYKIGQENVFVDVKYDAGKLTFKRNPLTLSDEFEYMWAELRPKFPWFAYIYSTTYTDRNK